MKRYLLLLLVPFLFLNPVKAEECTNLYPGLPGKLYINGSLYYSSSDGSSILQFATPGSLGYDNPNYQLKLDNTKTYTLFAIEENGNLSENLLPKGAMSISGKGFANSGGPYQYINITPGRNGFSSNGFLFMYNNAGAIYDYLQSLQFWLVEGEEVCIPSSEEPEPNPPPTPTPVDSSYTDFLNLYLDKLGLIANFSLENKYMLSFIGILILFIFLELFLFLLRGRRRR